MSLKIGSNASFCGRAGRGPRSKHRFQYYHRRKSNRHNRNIWKAGYIPLGVHRQKSAPARSEQKPQQAIAKSRAGATREACFRNSAKLHPNLLTKRTTPTTILSFPPAPGEGGSGVTCIYSLGVKGSGSGWKKART